MTQRTRSANLGGTVITSTGVVLASGLDVSNQSNAAYFQANTAKDTANSAFNHANNAFDRANAAYVQANTARSDANTTFATVNSTFGTVNTSITNAHNQANTARSDANTTFATINTTFSTTNTTFGSVNTAVTNAHNQANAAYGQANSARSDANTTFATVNSTFGTVNTAVTNAHNQANAAYNAANGKLSLTGGTVSGSLSISGNLTISGNTSYINVSTYSVSDPLIYLASNNETSDVVDIGFIGGKNTGGTYSHTGLARDASDGTWYLFDGLPEEAHTNNVISFNNSYLATLRANINANSILLTGNSVATQANLTLAHNQANAARSDANTTFGTVNTTFGTLNTNIGTAYTQANNAYAAANNRVLKSGDTMTGSLVLGAGRTVGNGGIFLSHTGLNTDVFANGRTAGVSTGWGTFRIHQEAGNPGLIIAGDASQTAPYFRVQNNAESALLVFNASGNLGVGISSPEGILHVKSTSAYPAFLFESANTAIYAGPYLNLRNPSLSTNFGETSIQHTLLDPNDLTNVVFQIQQRTTNSSFVRQILVYEYKNQNWQFFTNGSERMRITSGGNVGIGTSSPEYKLQVSGTISSTASITETHTSTGFQYKESFSDHVAHSKKTSNTYAYYWRTTDDGTASGANSKTIANWYNDRLEFYTNNAERVRIDSNGKLLVGFNTSKTYGGTAQFNTNIDAIGTAAASVVSVTASDYNALDSTPTYASAVLRKFGPSATGNLYSAAIASAGWAEIGGINSSGVAFGTNSSAPLVFGNVGTERMRIDTSGNIGVGTTSPTGRLHSSTSSYVPSDSNITKAAFVASGAYGGGITLNDGGLGTIWMQGSGTLMGFGVGTTSGASGTMYLRNGSVGIAQIPTVSTTSSLFNNGDFTIAGTNRSILGNIYYSGGWKYAANGYGWGFRENASGLVQFITFPNNTSGAGAAATDTYLMTLDIPNQRVGIGTVSPTNRLSISGTCNATGDFRAPVFYDSDNTGYYSDPAANSILNTQYNYVYFFHGVGANSGNANHQYAIYQEAGAWSHPYPDLNIAYHTGIKIGAYVGYNGTRIYNNSDFATQIASFGDGDNAFRSYDNVIAYASDGRLKENLQPITNAIEKVKKITGMTFDWKPMVKDLGFEPSSIHEAGVIAQDVEAVLPEAVEIAPFDYDWKKPNKSKSGEKYLTVKYEKLVPLLIQAIKEQQEQIDELKNLIKEKLS